MISVLYVDDDESFCGFFKIYLQKMGDFSVTTVRYGHQALDMILDGPYDIVVSDYQMPGMTGLDLLRAYRKKGVKIPFILFTGKGREEVVIEAINEGAAFYLQKGGDQSSLFAELAHKIRQAVHAEEAQRALLENEEKFRLLFETARDGIILISDWSIRDCNNHAALMFHLDRSRLLDSDFFLLAPEIQPDGELTREKAEIVFKEAYRAGGAFVTWKFSRLDGTEFDAEMSISRLDIKGKVLFQAIIRDITERLLSEKELGQRNADLHTAYQELMASEEELKRKVEELRLSKSKVRESEKRYKDLADLLPEGVFECSLDGTITYVNHQAFTMFGFDPAQGLNNISVFRFIIPEDHERAKEIITQVLHGNPSKPHEYIGVRLDGSTFPIIIHSAPAVVNGTVVGLRGVIIDISMRKQAEDAIRESKQQLADVIDFFPDATVVINKAGEVIFWNRAIAKMTGIDARDILGKSNYEYSLPFYMVRRPILVDYALHPELIPKKEYAFIRQEGDVIIGESYIPGLGSGTTYFWGVASPLRNADGDIFGAIECIRDITGRKEAEEALKKSREELEKLVNERTRELVDVNLALRESESRYRTLVDLSPDAIFVHNGIEILYSNPAGVRLFGGETEEDILGRDPFLYVHPDFLPLVKKRIETSLSGLDSNLPQEEVFLGSHGEHLQVEVSSRPIRYRGDPAVLVVARDIRARKKAEKQLREYARVLEDKNHELDFLTNRLISMNRDLDDRVRERTDEINRLLRQKDDFINQLGHDLKTPLTPLIALLPSLLHEEEDPDKRILYSVLLRSVYSIREQTDKILTLARLSRQDGVVEYEMIHPVILIRQAVEKNWLFIKQKKLDIEILVPDDLVVRFSARDASSVFDNLISNAIKYTGNGGNIRIYSVTDDNAAIITVEDTGIGLTQEEAVHVFDEFYMADRSRHDRQSSGLGLAIVKRVMECYGGKVWVESDGPGHGSRFMICLPITRDGCCNLNP
ncbi:PAS domain S-box protein [Methanospirillum sp.]